jgi:hypothetical protein
VVPEPVEKAQMCPFGESTLLLGGDTTPAHQVNRERVVEGRAQSWASVNEHAVCHRGGIRGAHTT